MPSRSNIFVTNYYYHIYNKSIDFLRPFELPNISYYFLNLLAYYRHVHLKMSYSETLRLDPNMHANYFVGLEKVQKYKVEILAFCLIPNHFHLLIKQGCKGGISKFMGDVLNGITRFYNIANGRKGPLFLPSFRSKPIVSEEHLIHVSRYIHLNPYVAGLLQNIEDIWGYNLSSAEDYLRQKSNFLHTENVLGLGYFLCNKDKYKAFVESGSEQGRTRAWMKYVEKWGG